MMSPRRTKSRQRRVALLIESSRAYARELIRGIARYNREQPHWIIEFTPRGLEDTPPAWLKDWNGHGILARVNDRRMARALLKKNVPVVDMRRSIEHQRLPSVGPDDNEVARLVVEHFRERGFHRFGCVGLPSGSHKAMDARADHFRWLVRELGCEYHEFRVGISESGDLWDKQCRQIRRWIERLERPVAVMACNDDLGLQVLNACRRAQIQVPDEIVVAGVGNDECLCDLTLPALTSVDLNPRRIGYQAAALLDGMMSGHAAPTDEIVICPRGIVSRRSTDVVATEDAHVAEAIRFIRQHACDGIRVADVLKKVHLSRPALEPRFKRILGRTIHQELQRVRISRVQEMLATTELPFKQIARQTGFLYPEYLMRVFRQATGQTLKEFRESSKVYRELPESDEPFSEVPHVAQPPSAG